MAKESAGLTRGQLAKAADCPFYVIDYLKSLSRLPLMTPQRGSGHFILYHPTCVQIVQDHLVKQRNGQDRD